MTPISETLPLGGRIPASPPPVLAPYVAAGVLEAADVHVAARLTALGGDPTPEVVLGAALAVRASRLGHVCVDLATIAAAAAGDAAAAGAPDLAWPDPGDWRDTLARSPLVARGMDDDLRPLRLAGSLLYLDRYWREERQVASDLLRMAAHPAPGVDVGALRAGLDALFPSESAEQRVAAACGVLRRLTVIGGGPGTGKTTTIARLLALLDAQPGGLRPRLVALAAPTGKAAARMQEAVQQEAASLAIPEDTRARLTAVQGSTLHRLLRRRPGSETRFRHDRSNRLPHTVVIVDEASMTSLSLMARLLEALRDDARLVLVGDPDQLASVEAGAVLGDIIGPARDAAIRRPAATARLEEAVGFAVPEAPARDGVPIGDGVAILRRVHRFGGGIARLADAIRRGDAAGTLAVLGEGLDDVRWIPRDPAAASVADIAPIRDAATAAGTALIAHARAGDAAAALDALEGFRLLCPHRHGPHGVDHWGDLAERWLTAAGALPGTSYPGRPLIVTENDYSLRLFNGDTGVIVLRDGRPTAAFPRGEGIVEVSPSRLANVAPVYAMTIHKSQGSQFRQVAVLVAPADSPISTRELLYTAVTRARERVMLLGEAEAIAAAVERPVARASGLRSALWGDRA